MAALRRKPREEDAVQESSDSQATLDFDSPSPAENTTEQGTESAAETENVL